MIMQQWVKPVLLSMMLAAAHHVGFPAGCPTVRGPAPEYRRALTWPEAARRVLERHPGLKAAAEEPRAMEGRVVQAGLKPNPELSFEIENVLGTGEVGLGASAEATAVYAHRIEGGGKRSARVRAAEAERDAACREVEARRAEVVAEAAAAFVDVMHAQERLANGQVLLDLSRRIHETVRIRVEAGKDSPVEETRAAVSLASARLEVEKANGELRAARDRLAGLWGDAEADFDGVSAPFRLPEAARADVPPAFEGNPERRKAEAVLAAREAAAAAEASAARTDLTVSAGVRYLNDGKGVALVGGLSIPLNRYDRRQGAIAEAKVRVEQARAELRSLEARLRSTWRRARHALDLACLEERNLSGVILPGCHAALESLQEGYRLGKFDFLAVLDAERTHLDVEMRIVDAVAAALKAAVELHRLSSPDGAPDPYRFLNAGEEVTHD
ncbi:MAG: TolC family protein [Acidobacteria bacterium]|nr:TolC family protein [Acidobacteriota bacterium]